MRTLMVVFMAFATALLSAAGGGVPSSPVTALAYSPDGKLLAAASRGIVQLLDGSSGDVIDELKGLEPRVTALGFSSDGNLLAVAAGSPAQIGLIHLYKKDAPSPATSTTGWKRERTLEGHQDLIHAVAFRPDSKELISAGYERLIHVWNPVDGKLIRTLKDHSDSIYALAYRPDGVLFASAAADRTIKVWKAESGERLFTLGQATDWLYTLAWSPDGKQLVSGGVDKSLRLYNVTPEEGTLLHNAFAHAAPILKVAFTADGKQLVTLGEDRLVKVWDTATLKESRVFPILPETALAMAVSPTTGRFAIARYDGIVTLHDLANGTVLSQPLPNRFPLAAFDAEQASRQGQVLTAPAMVSGHLPRAGAELKFSLDLKTGQELGVQATRPEGSQLDPALRLVDQAGKTVADGRGALLGYRAEQGGRYTLVLRDQLYRGGPAVAFRLKAGPLPIVTRVFPLGLQRGSSSKVSIAGVNLGSINEVEATAPASAEIGSRLSVAVRTPFGPALNPPRLVIDEFATWYTPWGGSGRLPAVPFTIDSFLDNSTTGQQYATWPFQAKRGQRLLIEVHARRLGSPLDSVIEILDNEGKPVPRAVLRSTALAYTTLRDHDSGTNGIRHEAMDGFAMGDFAWLDGELLKIEEMPRNPDDDCRFYSKNGRRLGWLGTTPRYHAQGSSCYRVEVHPPGAAFPPNGFPVFTLNYENDDGGPGFGKDSYLVFDPPEDGEYGVRVRDALSRSGPDYVYRLTIRPPRPDFKISVAPGKFSVVPGHGQAIYYNLDRRDEFAGAVELEVRDLPAGWFCPKTFIGADVAATAAVLFAEADAKLDPSKKPSLIAKALIDGKEVTHEIPLGPLEIAQPGDLLATTEEKEVTLKPGGTTQVTVQIERRNKFDKRVPVEVRGLPYGVRVNDVGLNGVLITEKETVRTFQLYCEPWVKPQEKPLAITAQREGGGETATRSVLLKIGAGR